MENNIINTLLNQERVTSTYADIYFDDTYCKSNVKSSEEPPEAHTAHTAHESELFDDALSDWISPSDLLIGKVQLKPPLTSKITRGKTHEGILSIGNEVLQREHMRFLASVASLLRESDESWRDMEISEKSLVNKKVTQIFHNIFLQKKKTMNEEIMAFYEKSLNELETYIQSEVQTVLRSVRANMISALNIVIPGKLKKEKLILEDILKKKYEEEVEKIEMYYKLLLDNELKKHNDILNSAINDRNEALRAFCKQIDAERLTASMYVMSLERKKCKIKQLFLEKLQNSEVREKVAKIKEGQDMLDVLKQREVKVSDINKQWEDKMKKVLEIFLKFVSFSLKLLPEQSNFLLDFQKMVVLQINEMQKQPNVVPNILIDEDTLLNVFEYNTPAVPEKVCDAKPFVLVGDLSDPIPPRYGSTETLPSSVDLPFLRYKRQYVYAKCHGYEEIKKFLKSQECQCAKQRLSTNVESPCTSPIVELPSAISSEKSVPSLETLLFDDMTRVDDCPARRCGHFIERNLFPFLPCYLDFTEDNFTRVKAILGKPTPIVKAPELINVKNIAGAEIPFAETKEKYRHVQTQYSVQEIKLSDIECTCVAERRIEKPKSLEQIKETNSQLVIEAITKRKASIGRMLDQYPNLLKMFSDENYDFKLLF